MIIINNTRRKCWGQIHAESQMGVGPQIKPLFTSWTMHCTEAIISLLIQTSTDPHGAAVLTSVMASAMISLKSFSNILICGYRICSQELWPLDHRGGQEPMIFLVMAWVIVLHKTWPVSSLLISQLLALHKGVCSMKFLDYLKNNGSSSFHTKYLRKERSTYLRAP
jgi:hypothetical protein